MSGKNPKPSQATLEKLKDALSDLQALQSTMQQGKNPDTLDRLNGGDPGTSVRDISGDLGDLLGSGHNYSTYYGVRAGAVGDAVSSLTTGVTTLITLLSTTIQNYDTNEQNHADAANNTGTGNNSSGSDGKG